MAFDESGKIWFNGEFVDWKEASVHALSHVVHYGSSVFEGIRCYDTKKGSAVFRLPEHVQRLYNSQRDIVWNFLHTEEFQRRIMDTSKINSLRG